ncbi:MAG: hypothetical protein EHJ95_04675 [Methanobacteriota archaeon]|nr:MAG: hypothetical protein EHJ95_04675 [Euryarchaeota archaeon]
MENLKKAVIKVINTAEVVDDSLADKKLNFAEGVKIGASALAWIWIFKNIKVILEEIVNLTDENRIILNDEIKTELDLRNDVVEGIVEQVVEVLLGFAVVMTKAAAAKVKP